MGGCAGEKGTPPGSRLAWSERAAPLGWHAHVLRATGAAGAGNPPENLKPSPAAIR